MAFAVHAAVGGSNGNLSGRQYNYNMNTTTSTSTGSSSINELSAISTSSTTANWDNVSTGQVAAVDDATVDGYAMQVLEDASPPDVSVDADYLGPYITGLLRAELHVQQQPVATCTLQPVLEDLPDYDNVVELLQEHCSMKPKDAKVTLAKISQAVMTGMVPVEHLYSHNNNHNNNNNKNNNSLVNSPPLGPTTTAGARRSSLSALQLLETVNVEATAARRSRVGSCDFTSLQLGTAVLSTTTAAANTTPHKNSNNNDDSNHAVNSVISPVQAKLLPVDLLGAIDDYEEEEEDHATAAAPVVVGRNNSHNYPPPGKNHHTGLIPVSPHNNEADNTTLGGHSPLPEDEFPSLAVAAASKLTKKASRSCRSRQGSIDESSVSEHSSKKVSPHLQPQMEPSTLLLQQQQQQLLLQQQQQNPYYYSLEPTASSSSDPATMLQMACDMLMTMNPDMGQDAIFQAATMAQSDVGVAQYLMDCAMTAPPVCRHLLHSGCYRRDCQFSHDLEGHTCVFWLRGRCGKGTAACPFLHGYNEKWLVQLAEQQQQQAEMEQAYLLTAQQQHDYHYHHHQQLSDPNGAALFGGEAAVWDQESVPAAATPLTTSTNSFANIASQGYNDQTCFQQQQQTSRLSGDSDFAASAGGIIYEETKSSFGSVPTMKIPQDVWNPHERRDSSAFHIADPLERYREVSRNHHSQQQAGIISSGGGGGGGMAPGRHHPNNDKYRTDVVDLHFQSTKTFAVVLEEVLPEKLASETQGVWIVTGTGHHVGSKTHQKGGGVLELAVMSWLTDHGYDFCKGRDRNGHGGAVFVKKSGSSNSSSHGIGSSVAQ